MMIIGLLVQEGSVGSVKQLLIAVTSVGVTQSALSHLPATTAGSAAAPPYVSEKRDRCRVYLSACSAQILRSFFKYK